MDEEDIPPVNPQALKNLAPLSVSELQAYILELRSEIERVEGEIKRKQAHLQNAASLFKKS